MLISLITATYNSAETLRDTFESVLAQSHKDIEYWIIDGGSKDKTIDIIKEYESKFHGRLNWISEPDKGIYDAMNKGIERATGDIVGILNSDDMFATSEALELIANSFDKYNTGCVFGNLLMVHEQKTDKVIREWNGNPYPENGFRKGWHPAHPTFYCKRKYYEKFGLYDTSYKIAADFELMLRFIEKNKIKTHFIDEYIVKMRVGGASNRSIKNILTGRENILRAFRSNGYKVNPYIYYTKRITPKIFNILSTRFHRLHK